MLRRIQKIYKLNNTYKQRLDQSHLYPNLEVPGLTHVMARNWTLASRVWSKHSRKESSRQLVNGYSEHLHMSPWHGSPPHQCMCYMNIHEHTWTALAYRPHRTCKADGLLPSKCLASPHVSNHVGVTTIARLDQSHVYPNLEVPGLIYSGRESNPGLPHGKRALQKVLSRQLGTGYSEHLHMSRGNAKRRTLVYIRVVHLGGRERYGGRVLVSARL